jgi:hypothetical protein
MCAAKIDGGAPTSPPANESTTPAAASTIVAVVPSYAAENLTTILGRVPSGIIPTAGTAEGQDFIDASDLTREQWIQVL